MKSLKNRYIIQNKLGQGGSSITYAAIDKETNERVAIKALSLTGLDDWKKIELFEREAKILQQLNHPAIPSYLDYFQIDTEDDIYFYIVQQLAPGQSLAHLISEGWQPDEATVKNIAIQISEILVYLQQLTPPVIHRDIKPQNVIYQPDTGKLFLVDFGAVQDAYQHTMIGSTVVGTYGYMAPEQYRGGAVLATDLYSLGCTLLFLLTGESPAELPQKKLKIDFRKSVRVQRDFAEWIDKLIEPNINSRFPHAEAALLVLQDKANLQDYQSDLVTKLRWSSISISKDNEQLIIDIPPPYQRKRVNKYYYICLLWSIISLLNRLAIFVSVGLFGKFLIIVGCYQIIFVARWNIIRILLILNNLLLMAFLLAINSFIPGFSLMIVAINTIVATILKQNFVQQLFLTTRIIVQKNSNIIVKKKLFRRLYKEEFQVRQHRDWICFLARSIPRGQIFSLEYFIELFMHDRERKWLQSEIEQFLK